MPYANNQGICIYYQVEGKGEPIILHHGSAESLDVWYESGYVELLKPNYQLILMDARGHGHSDKPHDVESYSLALRVSDVVAVLDDLGIRATNYWGYSMGGWIGFGIAKYAAPRIRSLILGGAHPYTDAMDVFDHIDGTDEDAFIGAMEAFVDVRITPKSRSQIVANDLQALAAAMNHRHSLESTIPTMTMPCCLYVGTNDRRISKVERCVKRLPNAQFVPIMGLDHAQTFDHPELILPPIEAFLGALSNTKLPS